MMKEKEVLELTFSKLYEEIDDVTYDCEDILRRIHLGGLISGRRYQNIMKKHGICEKNR